MFVKLIISPCFSRSPPTTCPVTRSYTWLLCPEICWDTQNMIMSRARVKYSNENALQHYCQIKTYLLRSHPMAPRCEAASWGVTRTNVERREREREMLKFNSNSNPSKQLRPARTNLTFSIILSHSGSTLSNNPGPSCQLQWTETNAMIEFHPKKTIHF